jgi:glycosyltransferase involved in cell wall biosynthesis
MAASLQEACLILTMNPEQLAHLDRIGGLVDALGSLPWMETPELEQISLRLLDFDSSRWSFLRVLSFPLYAELTALLAGGEALPHLKSRPRIAVVMPVYAPRRDLLKAALASLRGQVGVAIDCLISVDGRVEDRQLVEELVAELEAAGDDSHWRVSVFLLERNRGVGLCRNRAFQEVTAPFFSCLDADDIFHPLRCLHALLALQSSGVDRLNTGWSRVSLDENKIVLINDRLYCTGQSSFLARTEILSRCGFQAGLRHFEDTEFMLRQEFFGVSMQNSPIVGHYFHTEPRPDYASLSSVCRQEVHPISGHPYLCGTVIAEQPESWLEIERSHRQRYHSLLAEALRAAYPADPDAAPGERFTAD